MTEPQVTNILAINGGVEVLLHAGSETKAKNYSVRIGHAGNSYGIHCEFAMQTTKSRRGTGLAATVRREVKRQSPLFARLEAIAKVAIIKALDAAKHGGQSAEPRQPASGSGSGERAWIRLPSRRHMDLMNPDPLAWTDSDLAKKLARTPRWAGESSWPWPLSVAQHSLTVLAFVRQMSPAPLTAAEQLRELLHDAEEGFIGFDPISPLKRALGESFRRIADRLLHCVFERYGAHPWDASSYAIHKLADTMAAAGEAVHVVGWSPEEVVSVLGITASIPEIDPLASIYGGKAWEPWPAELAEARFLEVLVSLLATTAR